MRDNLTYSEPYYTFQPHIEAVVGDAIQHIQTGAKYIIKEISKHEIITESDNISFHNFDTSWRIMT